MLEGAARAAQVRDTRSETGVVYLLEIKASVFDRLSSSAVGAATKRTNVAARRAVVCSSETNGALSQR